MSGEITQVGFIRSRGAFKYSFDDKTPKRLKKLALFTAVGLTGQTKLYKKNRFRETVEGWWMKEAHGT